ncbi:hypothetical protein D3C73_1429390 [compost metagenome]
MSAFFLEIMRMTISVSGPVSAGIDFGQRRMCMSIMKVMGRSRYYQKIIGLYRFKMQSVSVKNGM